MAEAISPAPRKATSDSSPSEKQPVAPIRPRGKARKLWIPRSPTELDASPPVLLAEDVAGLRRETIGALLADVERAKVPGLLRLPGERGTLRCDRDIIFAWLLQGRPPAGARR